MSFELENAIFKRDIDTATRRKLASEGKALSDGSYPIENEGDLKNAAILARSGHGNSAGAKRLIAKRAKELGKPNPLSSSTTKMDPWRDGQEGGYSLSFQITKADDEQCIVTGVVLEPNLYDSQGDIATPEEIEKAAYGFMEASQKGDLQHNEERANTALVESYVAPQDVTLDNGELITKGSWVQSWRVHDPAVWGDIRAGKLTGFSMGGSAVRFDESAA